MYEYVITAGEGTMIDFGCVPWELLCDVWLERDQEIIIRLCDDDCETGR